MGIPITSDNLIKSSALIHKKDQINHFATLRFPKISVTSHLKHKIRSVKKSLFSRCWSNYILPPACEGRGKVIFSVCQSTLGGGGGVSQSQVLSQVTGIRSFPGVPQSWPGGGGTQVLVGGYTSMGTGLGYSLARSGWGTPQPGQDWSTPRVREGLGYPLARSGWD